MKVAKEQIVGMVAAFKLPPLQGGHKGQQLQALTDEVMYHIAALLREDLRGVYADAVHDEAGLAA